MRNIGKLEALQSPLLLASDDRIIATIDGSAHIGVALLNSAATTALQAQWSGTATHKSAPKNHCVPEFLGHILVRLRTC